MSKNVSTISKSVPRRLRRERGVALITALVLLLLLSGLIVAMVFSLRSDLLMNGYYRNFRGSFYAADSGLNIVREDLNNKLAAAVVAVTGGGGTLALNTAPFPVHSPQQPGDGDAVVIQGQIVSAYTSSYTLAGTGASGNLSSTAVSSWPESFKLDPNNPPTFVMVSCTPSGATGAPGNCVTPANNPTIYTYVYKYTVGVVGSAQNTEQTALADEGTLTFKVVLTPNSSTKTSFAAWGMFIDQFPICSGDLVPGTISGPVFTNGSWTFANSSTKYLFTDSVGQAGSQAGFDFGGGTGCDQQNAASDTKSGTTIAPTFNQGFNRSQNTVPLPTDSLNQEQAVLDGLGTASGSVTASALNASVKNVSGTPYPSGGAASGVYLPYKTVDSLGHALNPPQFSGGGIYVEGAASVQLKLGSTATAQTYVITQGSTVTTITVDTGAGTTVMSDNAGHSQTITGVPMNNNNSPATPGTSLYVNGNVTSLNGAGPGVASIQDSTALTITANGTVSITGDLIYKTEPVNSSDQLVSSSGGVLGIFTASGDILLNDLQGKNSSGKYNMEIDASIATLAQGGTGGLVNNAQALDYLKIVGGRIQNSIKSINTTQRDVFFDRRFGTNGFAPPFFPSTTVTSAPTADAPNSTSVAFTRTKWVNRSTTY